MAASAGEKSAREPVKVYFAGDTGYRSVKDGEDEDKVPVCPAFKAIGDKFGGFDYAMIPIGYVCGYMKPSATCTQCNGF